MHTVGAQKDQVNDLDRMRVERKRRNDERRGGERKEEEEESTKQETAPG